MIDGYLATDIEPTETCSAIINTVPSHSLNRSIGIVNVIIDILNGFKRGLIYGTKIRFPHALIMTFLLKSGSSQDKIRTVLRLTREHAGRLACYVALYKTILLLIRKATMTSTGMVTKSDWRVFVAGAMSGYVMFGTKEDSVNSQLVYYLISRVLVGGMKHIYKTNTTIQSSINSITEKFAIGSTSFHAWQAVLAWGMVMWLWESDADVLQRTLKQSMDYLYKEDGEWRGWMQFFSQDI